MRQSCDNFVAVGALLRPLVSAKRRGDGGSIAKKISGLGWQVIDLVRVRKNGVLRLLIRWSLVRSQHGPPYKTKTYRLSRDTLFNPCKHYVSTWSDFGPIIDSLPLPGYSGRGQ